MRIAQCHWCDCEISEHRRQICISHSRDSSADFSTSVGINAKSVKNEKCWKKYTDTKIRDQLEELVTSKMESKEFHLFFIIHKTSTIHTI